MLQVLELMARPPQEGRPPRTLCTTAAEIVEVSGAGVDLSSKDGGLTGFCSSDDIARRLLDVEQTLGEGVCMDVCRTDAVVDVPDLLNIEASRWMSYAPSACTAGARAVFGFPVSMGAVKLGVLLLYSGDPGPLSDVQTSDAHLMSSVLCRAILAMQAGAPLNTIAGELEREATFDFAVHQATGMVAVQGSMSLRDAMATLRAHAFATSVTTSALAIRVVAREVVFGAGGQWQDRGMQHEQPK
jgi:hypothetical protein